MRASLAAAGSLCSPAATLQAGCQLLDKCAEQACCWLISTALPATAFWLPPLLLMLLLTKPLCKSLRLPGLTDRPSAALRCGRCINTLRNAANPEQQQQYTAGSKGAQSKQNDSHRLTCCWLLVHKRLNGSAANPAA